MRGRRMHNALDAFRRGPPARRAAWHMHGTPHGTTQGRGLSSWERVVQSDRRRTLRVGPTVALVLRGMRNAIATARPQRGELSDSGVTGQGGQLGRSFENARCAVWVTSGGARDVRRQAPVTRNAQHLVQGRGWHRASGHVCVCVTRQLTEEAVPAV